MRVLFDKALDSHLCICFKSQKNRHKPRSVKMGLNAFAKSIDSCQPAHSAQADMAETFRYPEIFCMLTHYHTMPHFEALKIYSCGELCEKRRYCL